MTLTISCALFIVLSPPTKMIVLSTLDTGGHYWRAEYRNGRVISLNQVVYEDEDGNQIELIDTLADDKVIDLEAWLDRTTWELGFPKRLVEIARKRLYGIRLNDKDRQYLSRYRRKEQKRLF